jgi:hypothetical protein
MSDAAATDIAAVQRSVAGSPAGSEDAVGAAGPLLAMIGFLLMPFVWGVPESLVRHRTPTLATSIRA